MPVHRVLLVQCGLGGVGRALIEQVLTTRDCLLERRGLQLKYIGLMDSSGYVVSQEPFEDQALHQIILSKSRGGALKDWVGGQSSDERGTFAVLDWLRQNDFENVILVDATAAQDMEMVCLDALKCGHGVVLANKKPLVVSFDTFRALLKDNQLRHEATVGAGLPVVYTVRYLLDTGDQILSIQGCLSGTMGYLCAQMEEGVPFSAALAQAKMMGYTEPDPREDLSGMDVARKALILARLLGWRMELDDVVVEALYPSGWDNLSVPDFLEAARELDDAFATRVAQARSRGEVLRYVADVKDHTCRVGLRPVSTDTLMGSLKGTDNIVIIHTARYSRPVVICGAGAGVEVTAAGMLEDIVQLAVESRR